MHSAAQVHYTHTHTRRIHFFLPACAFVRCVLNLTQNFCIMMSRPICRTHAHKHTHTPPYHSEKPAEFYRATRQAIGRWMWASSASYTHTHAERFNAMSINSHQDINHDCVFVGVWTLPGQRAFSYTFPTESEKINHIPRTGKVTPRYWYT